VSHRELLRYLKSLVSFNNCREFFLKELNYHRFWVNFRTWLSFRVISKVKVNRSIRWCIITCGVTMLISWNSLCSRGHGKIFQFDGDRMLDVEISETLAGISLIVGSVGTLRWIGGARLRIHDSRQRCSVHDSTVRVGRVRTVKKSFRKIIIVQNGLVDRT